MCLEQTRVQHALRVVASDIWRAMGAAITTSRMSCAGINEGSPCVGCRGEGVCAGTPVHFEQTVREENAASVCGYTDTLRANSQGGGCGVCVREHRYNVSKH